MAAAIAGKATMITAPNRNTQPSDQSIEIDSTISMPELDKFSTLPISVWYWTMTIFSSMATSSSSSARATSLPIQRSAQCRVLLNR